MKTKGTIIKRTVSNKEYYYHKYLEDGKQRNEILTEKDAYSIGFKIYFSGDNIDEFLSHEFKLDVSYGESLFQLSNPYRSFKKRFCFADIEDFLTNNYVGKVLILYGLRRTGKTTLMFQSINSLSIKEFSKAAYIKCNKGDTIYDLFDDLKYLTNNGFSYIYIDEVTLLEDFVSLSSTLSDIYGLKAKIILSGTDSLGFSISIHNELYDRYKLIHTTYISYKEFAVTLGVNSIDQFIEYGGTMSLEGIDYNKTIKTGDGYVNEYVDSSIIHNIIHSLKNVDNGKYFFHLYDLYEKNELENVINQIIEDNNHRFAISVIEQDFKSHDYGSLKQLLSSPRNYQQFGDVLKGVNEEKLLKDLMDALNIINKKKQTHKIDSNVLLELEHYLYELDVLASIKEVIYPSYNEIKKMIFTQPGLRYSQAKTLIEILLDDPKLKQYGLKVQNALKEKFLSDIKGRMIEEIIIYETSLYHKDTFKMNFATDGEFDMVVLNNEKQTSDIYEIKYTDSMYAEQFKHLVNQQLVAIFEKKYYPIEHKYVLYRGDKDEGEVTYLNIEDYLVNLH